MLSEDCCNRTSFWKFSVPVSCDCIPQNIFRVASSDVPRSSGTTISCKPWRSRIFCIRLFPRRWVRNSRKLDFFRCDLKQNRTSVKNRREAKDFVRTDGQTWGKGGGSMREMMEINGVLIVGSQMDNDCWKFTQHPRGAN